MAISSAPTVVYREDDTTRDVTATIAYSFSGVTENVFTYPISLAGAKSVWVQNSTAAEAAEFYIPSYSAGAINVASDPIGLMQTSFVSDGTSERAGIGFDLMAPSTSGAGFIGGNNMPPALSVKHTGTTESVIIIHITY